MQTRQIPYGHPEGREVQEAITAVHKKNTNLIGDEKQPPVLSSSLLVALFVHAPSPSFMMEGPIPPAMLYHAGFIVRLVGYYLGFG